jgi:hypothetical protein
MSKIFEMGLFAPNYCKKYSSYEGLGWSDISTEELIHTTRYGIPQRPAVRRVLT